MLNINNVCSQVKTKFSGLEIIPPWNITSGIIFTTIFWWMTSSRNFVFPLLDSTNLDLGMITIGVEGLGSRSATVFFWKITLLHISINFMMRSIIWLLVIIYFYYFSFLLLLNRPWMWKLWVDLSTSRPLHKKVYANQKRGTKTCICQSRCSVIATTHAVMEYANQNSAYAICQSEYSVQVAMSTIQDGTCENINW